MRKIEALFALALFAAAALTGCAARPQAVPEGYAGPTATIIDTGEELEEHWLGGSVKANFYVLHAVDGRELYTTIQGKRAAYYGTGASFNIEPTVKHPVPTREITVKLLGQTYFGAPIQELLDESYSVSGALTFTPEVNATYFVRGQLGPIGSAVWLEDSSGRIIGEKITGSN